MGRRCVFPGHIVSIANYMTALRDCSPTQCQYLKNPENTHKDYQGQEYEQVRESKQPLQDHIVDNPPQYDRSGQNGEYDFWNNDRIPPAFHGRCRCTLNNGVFEEWPQNQFEGSIGALRPRPDQTSWQLLRVIQPWTYSCHRPQANLEVGLSRFL